MSEQQCSVCESSIPADEFPCPHCNWDNSPVIGCSGADDLRLLNMEVELARSKWENSQLKHQLKHIQSTAKRAEKVQEKPQSDGAIKQQTIAGIAMVWIPAGEFMMGSPEDEEGRSSDEGPLHQVTFRQGFWMGKYAVTQQQWQDVMGGNPSHFKGDNRPVDSVSWNDTQDFIKALNDRSGELFRLPSESEWEYAARAGTAGPFSFDGQITIQKANYDGNYSYEVSPKGEYRNKTVSVDSFNSNPWGLYQMHGNVWEWVQDGWHVNYDGSPTDGSAWLTIWPMLLDDTSTERVLRGGSWNFNPAVLRSANRCSYFTSTPNITYGFRLVHD